MLAEFYYGSFLEKMNALEDNVKMHICGDGSRG